MSAGRGSLLVLPDHRDVDRVDAALTALIGSGHHVRLTADLGPAPRYRAFLDVLRGRVRIVVGTRAAAFAPVKDLGLAVCWDDGDDLHAEPRSPYPHTREVLAIRCEQQGAALLIGSTARSVEAQQMLETGWARELVAERALVRRRAPRVVVSGDDDARDPAARAARLPSLALRTAREALADGPVLVQVPRAGYVPALACQTCRAPARCSACHGPLGATERGAAPTCRWCGRVAGDWVCPHCDGRRLRSVVVGAARTAEELGRAFSGVPVRSSGGASVLKSVDAKPALVVATRGAEPVAAGGYAAALLLDAWDLLSRPSLRAAEEAVRVWTAAASLVRSAVDGGRVVLVGEAGLAPVQAMVRWDAAGYAARELAERAELGLPPATTFAEVTGSAASVAAFLKVLELPDGGEVLGPVPAPVPSARDAPSGRDAQPTRDHAVLHGGALDGTGEESVRAVVRVARPRVWELARALTAARNALSTRRSVKLPRVQVDPIDIA
jgi:primosomal protein N' (replication factor Y)